MGSRVVVSLPGNCMRGANLGKERLSHEFTRMNMDKTSGGLRLEFSWFIAGEIGGRGAVEAVLAVDGGVDFGG
jgi:hypothetical protein